MLIEQAKNFGRLLNIECFNYFNYRSTLISNFIAQVNVNEVCELILPNVYEALYMVIDAWRKLSGKLKKIVGDIAI